MPFFGKLPRGKGQIYFGTGYNKWGMTNAVAAALGISADILGGQVPWADTIHHRITSPSGALSAVALNAGVAARLASDWGKVTTEGRKFDGLKRGAGGSAAPASEGAVPTPPVPAGSAAAAVPAEGQGKVYREGNRPVAVSTVAGTTCRLSAVCTHMGGILHWNDNEQSWDCPLHGSRFTNQGKLLEGPATRDLPEAPPA